jgi:O-acetyl-ADP-ribose deacetylase (regulator of RNase III)
MPITTITADLTGLHVDAIVNAAAPALLGGGGVDGAIHRAAGPALLQACRQLPETRPGVRCPTGEARVTPGFELPARYVIHTVGPIWRGGNDDEALLLSRCYRQSLQRLREYGLRSIAFPAISCGVYGYPAELAAPTAVAALHEELANDACIDVILCCYSDAMRATFQRALSAA